MEVKKIGRPLEYGCKISVCVSIEMMELLNSLPNYSAFIREAIQEKLYMKSGDPQVGVWFRNGSLISVKSLDKGYPTDVRQIINSLVLGGMYTVKQTWTWPSHSEVELEEFPGIRFNTINFVQTDEEP